MKNVIFILSILILNQFVLTAQTDSIAPTAVCSGSFFIYLDSTGQTTLSASQVDAGSFDNDTIVSYTLSRSNFDCIAIGSQSVRLYVTDAAGNTDSCTTPIIVLDSIAPIVQCNDISIHLDSNGQAIIYATNQLIANSSSEFTGTQGQDNWYYGVYPAFSASNFAPLSNFTGFIWNIPGVGATLDFPQIDPNGGHPPFEGLNWAVRRWIAEYSGTIQIDGDFYDRDLGGGDGAHVRILKNGVQVYEYLNIPGFSVNYSLTIDVEENDQIDFVIDPKFDASFDDTHFTQRIYIKELMMEVMIIVQPYFIPFSTTIFMC